MSKSHEMPSGHAEKLGGICRLTSILAWCCLMLLVRAVATAQTAAHNANAATDNAISDSLRERHLVHVTPHRVIFDASTHTATLTFSNEDDHPVQAQVQVLFAYTAWPHGPATDTILLTHQAQQIAPYDTIVLTPRPSDPFAGRWLTGVPTTVTLAPHQKKEVTVRITPPAHLPTQTYWARIIVLPSLEDRHGGKSKDTRTRYVIPIHNAHVPTLRDSVLVFYRSGPVTMGLTADHGVAQLSVPPLPGPYPDDPPNLWFRLPVRLTGTAPFDGVLYARIHDRDTGSDYESRPTRMMVYQPRATLHWYVWNINYCELNEGHYQLILRFVSPQASVPPAQRLPFQEVTDTIPFSIPEIPVGCVPGTPGSSSL